MAEVLAMADALCYTGATGHEMPTMLTIQNSDKVLVSALRSVIRLHPQAKMTVRNKDDGFYSEANIRQLETQVQRINDGSAYLVTKSLKELETLAQ